MYIYIPSSLRHMAAYKKKRAANGNEKKKFIVMSKTLQFTEQISHKSQRSYMKARKRDKRSLEAFLSASPSYRGQNTLK